MEKKFKYKGREKEWQREYQKKNKDKINRQERMRYRKINPIEIGKGNGEGSKKTQFKKGQTWEEMYGKENAKKMRIEKRNRDKKLIGRKHSKETKIKIGNKNRGKEKSEKSKEKVSEKMKKWWKKNRNTKKTKEMLRKRSLDLDSKRIIDLYINEEKTIEEIAKIFKVCPKTISDRLRKENIKPTKLINLNLKKIKDLYVNQKKPATEIARIYEVDYFIIYDRLKRIGIKIRDLSESNKGKHSSPKTEFKKGDPRITGKNNPNFNNYSSFEPYGKKFNNKLREQIRKRDNYTCQECGKHQKELKRKLSVHHIDYNKKNNSIFNLISLCLKCHIKSNKNRKHWTNYFKMKIFLKEFFDPRNIKVFNENRKLIAMGKI